MKNNISFSIEKNIITLTNKSLSIKIAPELGSNMFSMRYINHEIIYHEPKLLAKCGFTGTFILFPTPNRVENGTYQWMGERINQKVLLHGLVFDKAWDYKKPIIRGGVISVKTHIRITRKSKLYNAYPFPCTLALEYILYPKRVRIVYSVKNQGSIPMPFGFGLHPYFARASGNKETYITIPAKSWMEAPMDTLLPTGKLVPVHMKPTAVGILNLDHVYTNLNGFACIDYRTLGFQVILKHSRDFTHMVVYTGHKKAVCIENQTCSTNAINLWNKGFKKESHVLVVAPGKIHKGYVDYTIQPTYL